MLKRLLFASFSSLLLTSAFSQGTVISQENFNSGTTLPAGWSQTTLATDGGWIIGDPEALSSDAFAIAPNDGNAIVTNDDGCDCDKSADVLTLPAMNMTALTSAYLLFDLYYINGAYQGNQESFELKASVDNGTTWTTVKSFDGAGDWRTEAIDISSFAGSASVTFSFTYNDGTGWNYGAALDNIRFVEPDAVLRASLAYAVAGRYVDAIPAVLPFYDKFWVGQHFSVEGSISNDGFVPITSFTATWTQGAQTASQTYSDLDIPFTKTYEFVLDLPAIEAGANNDDYTITISNINGGQDNDATDNSESVNVNVEGVEPVAGRKVVLEEGTGTWCQWCPRGDVMMDFMAENYPTLAIPIAVHNADPMKVTVYDTGMGGLISGYPSGLVDRADGEYDPLEFEKQMIERLLIPPTVSVEHNVGYNATTRQITVESHLHFLQQMNGDFRIAMVITEDEVTGITSTWRQSNAYAGGANGPMGGYESLPGLVPANQMVYDHVARTIFNSFTGAAGSVPATNPAGSTLSFTSTYTHPVAQEVGKMHAITMLINNATGEIVNAEQTAVPFTITATNEPAKEAVTVDVYPNPVSDVATVALNLKEQADVQLRLADVTGKIVYEANMGKLAGEHKLPIRLQHLNAGTYMLTVNTGAEVTTKPVMVVR
ncbi:MAG: T9SS type A sorting domain-containing protein [Saprospiraceae bacterium]|nr:T9SS type A sorting domain-containing protein [Saprospiraceae bacterium]